MVRVGMLSGWHVHARGYAKEVQAASHAEVAAVYDEDPGRGRPWAEELGAPFYDDLDAFLDRAELDGVVVCSPTNRHREVMTAAARAGKAIFTEKVMALTVAECRAIAEAVQEAGVPFCISYPFRARPDALFVKQAVDEGLVGRPTLLRVRVAHDGASGGWLPEHFYDAVTCGGGAMMDLGAHPMYLARWILGKPARITALFNSVTGCAIEDNAVALIEFENKAVAVAETSFVSARSPFLLEVNGTEGTVLAGGPEGGVRINTAQLGGKLDGWISPAQLPPEQPRPIVQWLDALERGAPPMPYGLDDGMQLTALMEAAYQSAQENRTVPVAL